MSDETTPTTTEAAATQAPVTTDAAPPTTDTATDAVAEAPQADATKPPDTRKAAATLRKLLDERASVVEKHRAIEAREKLIAQREAEYQARAQEWHRAAELLQLIQEGDVDEAVTRMGIDPASVLQRWTAKVSGVRQPPAARKREPETPAWKAEIDALKAELAKREEDAKKQTSEARAAMIERQRAVEIANLARWAAENVDAHPILRLADPQAVAIDMQAIRIEKWRETGQVLDEAAVAGILEERARDLISRADQLRAALTPAGQADTGGSAPKTTPDAPPPARRAGATRTLTSRETSATATDPPKTQEERLRRAVERVARMRSAT